MSKQSYKVLILGAGAGGISVAAKLARKLGEGQIAIIDPSENHFYQPLWTLVGAGLAKKEDTLRKTKELSPHGVTWIKEQVTAIHPDEKSVTLGENKSITYDFLVVATGLKLDWERIEGLDGNLGKNGICTIYQYDQVDIAKQMIQSFNAGTALFVMPPPPIKCAGAPQKIMYLAENIFRNAGIRDKVKIKFATPGKGMFGIQVFADALDKVAKAKNIEAMFSHKITGVDAVKKIAYFDVTQPDGTVLKEGVHYDLLHIVPPMSAHNFISQSSLAFHEGDQKNWLAVDKHTLQHLKYPNIFGVGDVTGVPNSKTGAAIRSQYPIVVENLISVMNGRSPERKYNGYSSCPLITEIGKVMLAEFGYDGKLLPTFPLDPTIPRRSYWHLKKDFLPKLYWYLMLKGLG